MDDLAESEEDLAEDVPASELDVEVAVDGLDCCCLLIMASISILDKTPSLFKSFSWKQASIWPWKCNVNISFGQMQLIYRKSLLIKSTVNIVDSFYSKTEDKFSNSSFKTGTSKPVRRKLRPFF